MADDDTLQLPVDTPQFDTQPRVPLRLTVYPRNDMTPGPPSGAIEPVQPGYKLTPVDYDPFRDEDRLARTMTHRGEEKPKLSDIQELARKGATIVAGMPYALLKNFVVDPI